ncbi:GuaB3 family IMP dehydrogenase-related protein [bacterium]|nr:GuaB3 family IMP dehydrogenase-related protein [bacterium]
MEIEIGRNRKAYWTFGLDEISLIPSEETVDVDEVDVSFQLGEYTFPLPVLASAMDGAVDVRICSILGKLGGLAVLNLEGVQTRYENPEEAIEKIITAPKEKVIDVIKEVYREPIKEELIEKRIKQIKAEGVIAAASVTPANAERFFPICLKAGLDIFVLQSTLTTVRHKSSKYKLDIPNFCEKSPIPIIIGNCVTYEGALELMEAGASAVLVGVGPGAACTTRQVLGIGVPQVTAIADASAARDDYFRRTGRYVPVIADGGMRRGSDIAKAIACGADAVMIGSPIASAEEAPGKGYHWGMASFHPLLPRGTRIYVGILGTLKEILLGEAKRDDGTMNLIGALKLSMSSCGAQNIKEMQKVRIAYAPAIPTEGKALQR